MVGLTFGQVEAILAKVHMIASDKRTAFTSRLKHLQKQGLPKRARPGRGAAGTYNFPQLMQMAIGLELIQSGMSPLQAANEILSNWAELRTTVLLATYNATELKRLDPPEKEAEWLWVVIPETLRDLTTGAKSRIDVTLNVQTVGLSDIGSYFTNDERMGVMGEERRKLILNGTQITRQIILLCAFEYQISTVEELRQDVEIEVQQEQSALNAAVEAISSGGDWSSQAEKVVEIMGLRHIFRWTEEELAAAHAILPKLSAVQCALLPKLMADEGLGSPIDRQLLHELGLLEMGEGKSTLTNVGWTAASELARMQDEEERNVDPET